MLNNILKSNKTSYRYILRFAVQPGNSEVERFYQLVEFCKMALVDEVMFFINCEELNQGHLTIEETKLWMEVITKGRNLLNPIGVKTSINPWTTILHTDRGRKLKEGQDFTLMVDPYGKKASAVACPLCPKWREYLAEMYSFYATIKPDIVWVEDDFRLYNHAPLDICGCFCDRHMEEYSRRAGKKLKREEFVERILKHGEVHPYRKIWLDVSKKAMVDLAELLGAAVHIVSPSTKVGLMSSNPAVHCAEGRDWENVFKGLSAGNSPVSRPHLPSYTEVTSQNYILGFSSVSMMTKAFLPQGVEIYPELENFQNTRFSKSRAFTRFQIETSVLVDSYGITLNLFDMMGNGVLLNEGYQYTMAETKPFVNRLAELGIDSLKLNGVKIPICQESSYSLKIERGNDMNELITREAFWAQLLTAYGVANTYTRNRMHSNSIIAISGQYFRNLSSEELKDLFKNNFIIIEGEAAHTLWDMGYGYLAGITSARWYDVHSGIQAYEEVYNGGIFSGIHNARMSSQGSVGEYLEIKYNDNNFTMISEVKSPNGKTVGAGMVLYGNVFILPYGIFKNGFNAHLNTTRQEIIQSLLCKLQSIIRPTMVLDSPYVSVYDYDLGDRRVLIVVNASGDDLDEVKISIADDITAQSGIFELNRYESDIIKSEATLKKKILTFKGLKRLEVKAFVIMG